jgi:hypothetical protein
MYISEYDFGKKNFESVKKVAEHFNNVGSCTPSSADDIGVSGSFMMGLVRMGAVRINGKRECFVCIGSDHRGDLYRRHEANLYELTITASDFWKTYCKGVEQVCTHNKSIAENYVSAAKSKLTEVEDLLNKVGSIRI